MKVHKSDHWFDRLANWAAKASGRRGTFFLAFALIVIWLASGPIFRFSDTWQLVINTSTTIITFLMVFLIQSTQNRDTAALQLKLDELIRVTQGAHVSLLDLEELNEHELDMIRDSYERLAAEGRDRLRSGGSDQNCPDIDTDSQREGE